MKLLFCCWLVLPVFNGAAYLYENHVRRYVKISGHVNSVYSERQRTAMQMMSLDARKAVERYIESHGPDAFDRVIQAVTTITKTFDLYMILKHFRMTVLNMHINYEYVLMFCAGWEGSKAFKLITYISEELLKDIRLFGWDLGKKKRKKKGWGVLVCACEREGGRGI